MIYAICTGMIFMMSACGSRNKAEELYKNMDANETAEAAFLHFDTDLSYYEYITEEKEKGKPTKVQTTKIQYGENSYQGVSETQVKNGFINKVFLGDVVYYDFVKKEGDKSLYTHDFQEIYKDSKSKYIFKTEELNDDKQYGFGKLHPFMYFNAFLGKFNKRTMEGDSIVLQAEYEGAKMDVYIGKDGYFEKLVFKNKYVDSSIDHVVTTTFSHINETPAMDDLMKKAETAFKVHKKETAPEQYMSEDETNKLKNGDTVTKLPDIATLIKMNKFYDINGDGIITLYPLTAYYLRDEFTILHDSRPVYINNENVKAKITEAMKKNTNFQSALDNSLPGSRIDFKNGKWG